MHNQALMIADLEDEYEIELDPNFDPGPNGLCNGDGCRSDECDCWSNFRRAVSLQLSKQLVEAGRSIPEWAK